MRGCVKTLAQPHLINISIKNKCSIPFSIYKTHDNDGLLYAWFSSMHTRVDIILSCQKSEKELMSAVNHIYDTLCQLERTAK